MNNVSTWCCCCCLFVVHLYWFGLFSSHVVFNYVKWTMNKQKKNNNNNGSRSLIWTVTARVGVCCCCCCCSMIECRFGVLWWMKTGFEFRTTTSTIHCYRYENTVLNGQIWTVNRQMNGTIDWTEMQQSTETELIYFHAQADRCNVDENSLNKKKEKKQE